MFLFILTGYTLCYYFLKEKTWNGFTRIASTANALQCIYMVSRNLLNREMMNLYYLPDEASNNALYIFSSYLFIDGAFSTPEFYRSPNFSLVLSLLHHFVGSFGIFLIAYKEMGFFLGFYFAMTELSTPILNLSWKWRHPTLLKLFFVVFISCRLLTIPILLYYLRINTDKIYTLSPIQSFMCFYGSYTLIALNLIWASFLTRKVISN
jgi:hypothetical protein